MGVPALCAVLALVADMAGLVACGSGMEGTGGHTSTGPEPHDDAGPPPDDATVDAADGASNDAADAAPQDATDDALEDAADGALDDAPADAPADVVDDGGPDASPGDPTDMGPLAITSGEYRFPPTIDADIVGDRQTELWARVYRPQSLSGGPYPVLVFLHGNHRTCEDASTPPLEGSCEYSQTGQCTGMYPVMTPSYLGFGYIADRLASWGYVVVSINANLGINCAPGVTGDVGLNLVRGRLILKHLALLGGWSATAGTTPASLGVDLAGTLDLGHVALMGHSRAGEGIRAAYVQYLDPQSPWPAKIGAPVHFDGLFEISGNDGQTSRVLDAFGTAWHAILPGCDADNLTLEGVKPFDRMAAATSDLSVRAPKSYTLVRGANHRFYNTEWQTSDATGCTGTDNTPIFPPTGSSSPAQQQNFLQLGMAFFRAHVPSPVPGANAAVFASTFDPLVPLDPAISAVTQVDRSFIASPDTSATVSLDDMTTGADVAAGVNLAYGKVPEQDPSLRAALLGWSTAGDTMYFESDWAPAGSGIDLSGDAALQLRVSRQVSASVPADVPTDFSLRLVHADGSLSGAVPLSKYLILDGPPGGTIQTHVLLRTVSIPPGDFPGATLTAVRGLRLVFDLSPAGAIYVTGIRRQRAGAVPYSSHHALPPPSSGATSAAAGHTAIITQGNTLVRVTRLRSRDPALDGGLEIEVASATPFPVRDALVVLRVGEVETALGGYVGGDLHRLRFILPRADAAKLHGGEPVRVQ